MDQKKKLSPGPSPTRVEINVGFTSTRNFNAVRVDISIGDFVRAEETLDEAVDRVYSYVENKVSQKLEQAKKETARAYGDK